MDKVVSRRGTFSALTDWSTFRRKFQPKFGKIILDRFQILHYHDKAMTEQVLGILVLVSGGLLLAVAAVVVSRTTTATAIRWPELVARVAQTEVTSAANERRSTEALEVAEKARRVASARSARSNKPSTTVEQHHEPELLRGGITRGGWVAGATPPQSIKTGTADTVPVPVEFID